MPRNGPCADSHGRRECASLYCRVDGTSGQLNELFNLSASNERLVRLGLSDRVCSHVRLSWASPADPGTWTNARRSLRRRLDPYRDRRTVFRQRVQCAGEQQR